MKYILTEEEFTELKRSKATFDAAVREQVNERMVRIFAYQGLSRTIIEIIEESGSIPRHAIGSLFKDRIQKLLDEARQHSESTDAESK